MTLYLILASASRHGTRQRINFTEHRYVRPLNGLPHSCSPLLFCHVRWHRSLAMPERLSKSGGIYFFMSNHLFTEHAQKLTRKLCVYQRMRIHQLVLLTAIDHEYDARRHNILHSGCSYNIERYIRENEQFSDAKSWLNGHRSCDLKVTYGTAISPPLVAADRMARDFRGGLAACKYFQADGSCCGWNQLVSISTKCLRRGALQANCFIDVSCWPSSHAMMLAGTRYLQRQYSMTR